MLELKNIKKVYAAGDNSVTALDGISLRFRKNEFVSILGPSGKYETANMNAIQNLSWTANEKEAILDQIEHMSCIVNYPGSYIYGRYLKFAFLDAVNDSADPVDALSSYIDAINAEITRKREEFGLKTGDPS